MYYAYVTSGPSLLIESIDSMIYAVNFRISRFGLKQQKQELYGAHTRCAASQLHAARELAYMFDYGHVCVLYMYRGYNFQVYRKRKGIVGSAAVVICSHVCIYFVTLLISSCDHSYYMYLQILIHAPYKNTCVVPDICAHAHIQKLRRAREVVKKVHVT